MPNGRRFTMTTRPDADAEPTMPTEAGVAAAGDNRLLSWLRSPWTPAVRARIEAEARRRGIYG